MILLAASLVLATMLQAQIPAQRSSPGVVLQTRGILAAKQFTDFWESDKRPSPFCCSRLRGVVRGIQMPTVKTTSAEEIVGLLG